MAFSQVSALHARHLLLEFDWQAVYFHEKEPFDKDNSVHYSQNIDLNMQNYTEIHYVY